MSQSGYRYMSSCPVSGACLRRRSCFWCAIAETEEMRETATEEEKVDTDWASDVYPPGPLMTSKVPTRPGTASAII